MVMRCASGALKLLRVQPMVVSGVGDSGPLVVYLFGDAAGESPAGTLRWEGGQAGMSGPLTARQMEVLRYLMLGWDNGNIAAELGGSAQGLCRAITTLVSAPMFGSGLRSFQQAARGYLDPLWSGIQRPRRILCLGAT